MKKYLRKLKYEFTSYKAAPKIIPTHFDQGTWRENTSILNLFSNVDFDLLSDLKLDEMKIFGKTNKSWIVNTDFFNDYNFKNKKLKPAYFNTADVKVPYEASRLQYLQKQNISSMFTKEVKLDDSLLNIDIQEFPPIYWNSPMDVAIRTINLIIHRQFVSKRLHKSQILNNDEKLIDTYISQHFQYVKNNLENDGNVVGNHYLIELSAMLFYLANYKNSNYENDLEFTLHELKNELTHQFNNEGTNFEGSSHYAAFVTEALVLCKLSLEDIDKNHGKGGYETVQRPSYLGNTFSRGNSVKGAANIFMEGEEVGMFYGWKTDGIFQTGDQMYTINGAMSKPGDIKVLDLNGDGKVDLDDQTIIGNPNPDFVYGFNLNMNYKKFTLKALFNGVSGNDIANVNMYRVGWIQNNSEYRNIMSDAWDNRWTTSNPSNTHPSIEYSSLNLPSLMDRVLEDGSYLRLNSLTLNYDIDLKSNSFIESCNIYLQGRNLYTWTNYSGYDPEVTSFLYDGLILGHDWNNKPNSRTFLVGLNFNF